MRKCLNHKERKGAKVETSSVSSLLRGSFLVAAGSRAMR